MQLSTPTASFDSGPLATLLAPGSATPGPAGTTGAAPAVPFADFMSEIAPPATSVAVLAATLTRPAANLAPLLGADGSLVDAGLALLGAALTEPTPGQFPISSNRAVSSAPLQNPTAALPTVVQGDSPLDAPAGPDDGRPLQTEQPLERSPRSRSATSLPRPSKTPATKVDAATEVLPAAIAEVAPATNPIPPISFPTEIGFNFAPPVTVPSSEQPSVETSDSMTAPSSGNAPARSAAYGLCANPVTPQPTTMAPIPTAVAGEPMVPVTESGGRGAAENLPRERVNVGATVEPLSTEQGTPLAAPTQQSNQVTPPTVVARPQKMSPVSVSPLSGPEVTSQQGGAETTAVDEGAPTVTPRNVPSVNQVVSGLTALTGATGQVVDASPGDLPPSILPGYAVPPTTVSAAVGATAMATPAVRRVGPANPGEPRSIPARTPAPVGATDSFLSALPTLASMLPPKAAPTLELGLPAGLEGQEAKTAAAPTEFASELISDFESQSLNFLTPVQQQVKTPVRELGTDVAKSVPTMSVATSNRRSPVTPAPVAAAPEASAPVVPPASLQPENLVTRQPAVATAPGASAPVELAAAPVATVDQPARAPTPATPAQVSAAAHRAVAAVLASTDRFTPVTQSSADLQLTVGDAQLDVRVEVRAGVVHATFRTDSPELRAALAQEWQAASHAANDNSLRLAPPVFSGSDRSPTDAGSAFAGQNFSQARDQSARSAPEFFNSGSARQQSPAAPAADTAPATTPSRRASSDSSPRLHAFA